MGGIWAFWNSFKKLKLQNRKKLMEKYFFGDFINEVEVYFET